MRPVVAYVVIVRPGDGTEQPYSPFAAAAEVAGQFPHDGVHGLDPSVYELLLPLWYALLLPRGAIDVRSMDTLSMLDARDTDVPPRILLVTAFVDFPDLVARAVARHDIVVLAPDDLYRFVVDRAARLGRILTILRFSELSPVRLASLWTCLSLVLRRPDSDPLPNLPFVRFCDTAVSVVPSCFLHRQVTEHLPRLDLRVPVPWDDAIHFATQTQYALHAQAHLARNNISADGGQAVWRAAMGEAHRMARWPLVLAAMRPAPGASRTYNEFYVTRRAYPTPQPMQRLLPAPESSTSDRERMALGCMLVNRARSRDGIAAWFPEVPARAFSALHDLEAACEAPRPRPRGVQAVLRRISDELVATYTDDHVGLLGRSSSITAFTDFPIGLATLPGDTAPLCCRVPIAYRPLTPLTRALQFEFSTHQFAYLGRGFRVLVAIGMPPSDPAAHILKVGWEIATKPMGSQDRFRCDVLVDATVEKVRQRLRSDPYDILVLSAHGMKADARNVAGLNFGGRLIMGPELGQVPSLVIMQACSSCPRSLGRVSIGELLLRQGALAVIATLAPVSSGASALLYARFFANLLETADGGYAMTNLLQVWHQTAVSNAFADILRGSSRLQNWFKGNDRASSPQVHFMLRRSVGRLTGPHIYRDTINVIREMAAEDDMQQLLDDHLASRGFIPETLLYIVLGWPEGIVVHNPKLERTMDAFAQAGLR